MWATILKTFQSCELIERMKRNRLHCIVVADTCANFHMLWNSGMWKSRNQWMNSEKYIVKALQLEKLLYSSNSSSLSFIWPLNSFVEREISTGIFRIRTLGFCAAIELKGQFFLQIADWFLVLETANTHRTCEWVWVWTQPKRKT